MMISTSKYLVPLMLGTVASVLFCLNGCHREEQRRDLPIQAVESLKQSAQDPEFRARLSKQVSARTQLNITKEKLVDAMRERWEAAKAKMPGATDKEIAESLKSDAEYMSLGKRVSDINVAIRDNLRATDALVRGRMKAQSVPVSKTEVSK